jgi:hypothetical protein
MGTLRDTACICVLIACTAGSASAAEWVNVGHNGKTQLALDAESVDLDVSGGIGKVWARTQFNPPSVYAGKRVAQLMAQYEVDCDTQKFSLLRSIAYDSSGAVLISSDTPEPMEATVPDTTAETVVSAVCALLKKTAAHPHNK